MWPRLLLAALLGLGACGEVPRPFGGGNSTPGEAVLRRPPPARILVPPPPQAGLTDHDARVFAQALAEGLREQELPATAAAAVRPGPRDWRVDARFEPAGASVALAYALIDEKGERIGTVRAPRLVPMAAWANGDPAAIAAAAADAAPAIAALTGRADAARRATTPGATPARLPTVAIQPVSGAPGDGNAALTLAMREAVGRRGLILQEEAGGADYLVLGTVVTEPRPGGQVYIEIVWTVRQGTMELGRVAQLNEIPARAISGRWGDVAYVVAEEASSGVRQVLDTARESQGRASAANQRAAQPQRPGGIATLPDAPPAPPAPPPRIAPAPARR